MCKVPLDAYGPIGRDLSALLVGRSSSTIKGIHVHLGIIDADYSGQIHAMVSISEPPVTIQKRTYIAQLVPFASCVPNAVNGSHGTGHFGYTGAPQEFWAQKVTDQCLEKKCVIAAKERHPETISTTGITSSTDERQLTTAAKKTIEEVELALTHRFVDRRDTSVGVPFVYFEGS